MSPKKLTEDTKQEILKLYRETEETTSTLAERYGVSSSTISRFLKSFLSESEYEDLIQQKRLARTPKRGNDSKDEPQHQENVLEKPSVAVDLPVVKNKTEKKVIDKPTEKAPIEKPIKQIELPLLLKEEETFEPLEDDEDIEEAVSPMEVMVLEELLGEDLSDLEDDDDDDDDEDEDWEDDEEEIRFTQPLPKTAQLKILPLSSASFPKTCYLVIDRSSELITRPLKDFAELGKVSGDENQRRTLPVFDSHRVAKRFSRRRERVIKVPDAQVIAKTHSYLEAKGITRILLDGRIYSVSSN
ncbi:transposase [Aphanothece hegewaldii CCALA 016]|uniref:Transposase n=1 Tax=Aphanothece hegewaldii CCALA 016 TaxID=2107694 RepID=A0A2T1LX92_9CHRO|nr:helix-turn-helix domain-containing protein [Aphanothece hegewaldii]PSF36796.1 transposase [Aphanothece hegewaldii CCALA 016]